MVWKHDICRNLMDNCIRSGMTEEQAINWVATWLREQETTKLSPVVERVMKGFESGLARRRAYGLPSKH